MARDRTIQAAVLNIALSGEHSADLYKMLILELFSLKKPVQTRGDQHIVIVQVHEDENDPYQINGLLGRFTGIDLTMPWFDVRSLEEADEASLKEISIPENLRANYRSFFFSFDCRNHLLAFETYGQGFTISPNQVAKLFKSLVDNEIIVALFGTVSITVVQSEEGLEEVINIPTIKWLRIEYQIPNPDDHDFLESVIKKKMDTIGAGKAVIELEAAKGVGITSDEELKHFMDSALINGVVEASGTDLSGGFVRRSTAEHPKIKQKRYDPDHMSEMQAFRSLASRIIRRLE